MDGIRMWTEEERLCVKKLDYAKKILRKIRERKEKPMQHIQPGVCCKDAEPSRLNG